MHHTDQRLSDERIDAIAAKHYGTLPTGQEYAFARAIEAEVSAAAPAVPQWMPIETAPTGKPVLLFHPRVPPKRPGGSGMYEVIRIGYANDWPMRLPTHWLPLPAAPTQEERHG